jgi:hypothetical protein
MLTELLVLSSDFSVSCCFFLRSLQYYKKRVNNNRSKETRALNNDTIELSRSPSAERPNVEGDIHCG